MSLVFYGIFQLACTPVISPCNFYIWLHSATLLASETGGDVHLIFTGSIIFLIKQLDNSEDSDITVQRGY